MSKQSASGGVGFSGLLLILFIALKLLGKIEWSWVWVLAPGWIPLVIGFALTLFALTVYFITRGQR